MKLTHVRLLVSDYAACVAFYRDVMGLETRLDIPDTYAEFTSGPAVLGIYKDSLMAEALGSDTATAPGGEDAVVIAFEVDNVDRVYGELIEKGATGVTEPHDESAWYLRVAHVRDPDLNLIEINMPLPQGFAP